LQGKLGSFRARSNKQRVKILQSELQLAFLVKGAESDPGAATLLVTKIPAPLQGLDRCTADNLRQCHKQFKNVPLFQDVARHFERCYGADTADRAAGNIKCARAMRLDEPNMPQTDLPCDIHKVSQVLSETCDLMSADVAAYIPFAVALRATGALGKFRDQLRKVIAKRLRIFLGARPPQGATSTYRTKYLDMCFARLKAEDGHTGQGARKAELDSLLTGEPCSADIDWYIPHDGFSVFPEWVLRDYYATRLVALLVPSPCPIFPRHRWVGAEQTVSYILLLFVHQLLPQTVPLWLKAMGGKLKSRSNEILEIKDQWDKHFAQQDADTNGRLLVLEQQNESADNSNFMRAEENRNARGDALA